METIVESIDPLARFVIAIVVAMVGSGGAGWLIVSNLIKLKGAREGRAGSAQAQFYVDLQDELEESRQRDERCQERVRILEVENREMMRASLVQIGEMATLRRDLQVRDELIDTMQVELARLTKIMGERRTRSRRKADAT